MKAFTVLYLLCFLFIGSVAVAQSQADQDYVLRNCQRGVDFAAQNLPEATPEQTSAATATCPALVQEMVRDKGRAWPPYEDLSTWGCGLGVISTFNKVGALKETQEGTISQRFLVATLACVMNAEGS